MLPLHELQRDFCRAVTGNCPGPLQALICKDGLDPLMLLSIYRNSVLTRLTDALAAVYPVVCQLVDRRFFVYAADTFIRGYPPAKTSLVEYGADFARFLANFPPAAELGYLPDIARLEWSIHRVLHAELPQPISIGVFAEIEKDPGQVRLRIAPSARFVASSYPIDEIWAAHQGSGSLTGVRFSGVGVRLQVDRGNGLRLLELDAATWEFRARLADEEILADTIAAATSVSAHFDFVSALSSVFADGLVVGFTTDA
jgi:Putative DNA-binding domain